MKLLVKISILMSTSNIEDLSFKINSSFQENLLKQLNNCSELIPWRDKSKKDKKRLEILDPNELNSFALQKWETILYFIVGSTSTQRPSRHIVSLLTALKLINVNGITNKGYTFLLMSVRDQLWYILRNYLLQSGEKSSIETLQLLFKLALCIPGQPYIGSMLTHTQQILLSDLMEFGMIFTDQNSPFFYPTTLATTLLQNQSLFSFQKIKLQVSNTIQRIKIIVETNFKIYVYTSSSLHVDMLRVFLDIECILPNLVVCVISRSSVKRAFKKGIKAKNLIDFLKKNAHELCLKRERIVPDNVSDQIILWEQERDRINSIKGILYEFKSVDSFKTVLTYTLQNNYHLWSNENSMRIFVRESHHATLREYFQKQNIV